MTVALHTFPTHAPPVEELADDEVVAADEVLLDDDVALAVEVLVVVDAAEGLVDVAVVAAAVGHAATVDADDVLPVDVDPVPPAAVDVVCALPEQEDSTIVVTSNDPTIPAQAIIRVSYPARCVEK